MCKKLNVLFMVFMLFHVAFAQAAEHKESNESHPIIHQFKPMYLDELENFSENYPALNQGFQVLELNLQEFMVESLRNVGQQLDNQKISITPLQYACAVSQAEDYFIDQAKEPFITALADVITTNRDIMHVVSPIFNYVKDNINLDFIRNGLSPSLNDYEFPAVGVNLYDQPMCHENHDQYDDPQDQNPYNFIFHLQASLPGIGPTELLLKVLVK